jgi:hypothetical protein
MMNRRHNAIFFSVLLMLTLMTLSMPVTAQTQQEPPPASKPREEKESPAHRDWVSRVFEVKYADVNQLASVLEIFGVGLRSNRDLKVIGVSGPRETLTVIEEAIRRLDVPPPAAKNVELTFYLLIASEQPDPLSAIPPQLQETVDRLKSVFTYRGFRLLDTVVMRNRDGQKGEVSGLAPSTIESAPTRYSFSYNAYIAPNSNRSMIRIDGLRLGIRLPIATGRASGGAPPIEYTDTGISTNIDIHEGQKVVVGKASIGGTKDALFLVLAAKVVN